MNETIESLLKIDRDTEKLKEDTEKVVSAEHENAGRVLDDFSKKSQEEADKRLAQAVKKIESETEETINALKEASDKEIAELRAFFATNKKELADRAFRKLGLD